MWRRSVTLGYRIARRSTRRALLSALCLLLAVTTLYIGLMVTQLQQTVHPGIVQDLKTRQSNTKKSKHFDCSLDNATKYISLEVIKTNGDTKFQLSHTISEAEVALFRTRLQPPYTAVGGNTTFFILSAVGRNESVDGLWQVVSVNGWISPQSLKIHAPMQCCFLYPTGQVYASATRERVVFFPANLTAATMLCRRDVSVSEHLPVGVAVSHTSCSVPVRQYVRPVFPRQQRVQCSVAVCLKVAYGNVDPLLALEWLEYHRHLGVTKVVVFTYNLTTETRKVFHLYEEDGFLEQIAFDFPLKETRGHALGDKVPDGWTDEQVTVFDCHNRLRGFQFVAVVDLDEFIVPIHEEDLCKLMTKLTSRHPSSATFSFSTELFALDWGKGISRERALVPQFTERTEPMRDRVKLIHLPDRLVPGGLITHAAWPCTGYKRTSIAPAMAVLKHYRSCRPQWLLEKTCFNRTTVTDTLMARKFQAFSTQLQQAKHRLGLRLA